MTAFAAALSEHPVTAYAAGEVCGEVLERVGAHPDVAVIFTTLAHTGALEDIAGTVTEVLHPTIVLGAASESIIATGREVEGGPGIALWAGQVGPAVPVRLSATQTADGSTLSGYPDDTPFPPSALVLIGDPYSVPIDEVVARAGVPIVGGMASGARGPGGNRLLLDGRVYTDGAVGVLLGPGIDLVPLVSQGCRPVGRPFVVTDGGGNIIRTLAGQTALSRIDDLAGTLSQDEIRAVNQGGLHLGRVVDERKLDFGLGDFLVRQVIGGDRDTGAIAVDDEVMVGTTVQFHLRDAEAAHEDLDALLAREGPRAEPEAALVFTCNGRGRRLFGVPDHDAQAVEDRLGRIPTAGIFAAGEIGPVGGETRLHSFTASMLLVRTHTTPRVGFAP